MPVDPDASMLSLWQQQSGGSAALLDVRSPARPPPAGWSGGKPEANTIRSQFPRLPNPDMVLYVFRTLTATRRCPGYSTVFPFYTRPQYALPGERLTPP